MGKRIVLRMGKTLRPDDEGFEEAARKYGLWLPWGEEKPRGTHIETSRYLAPDSISFEDILKEVLAGSLDAEARIVKESDG